MREIVPLAVLSLSMILTPENTIAKEPKKKRGRVASVLTEKKCYIKKKMTDYEYIPVGPPDPSIPTIVAMGDFYTKLVGMAHNKYEQAINPIYVEFIKVRFTCPTCGYIKDRTLPVSWDHVQCWRCKIDYPVEYER